MQRRDDYVKPLPISLYLDELNDAIMADATELNTIYETKGQWLTQPIISRDATARDVTARDISSYIPGVGTWGWPVYIGGTTTPVKNVTSKYGWRSMGWHGGIDIAPSHANCIGHRSYKGSNPAVIVAVAPGTVIVHSESTRGYGKYLTIDHGDRIFTLYAHCHQLLVSRGQKVSAGQVIAYLGSTGNSTGPHLHFEVRVGGNTLTKRADPMNYIS